MPRRFRKRDDLHKVMLPGVGLVHDSRVLEGDQWGHFAPDSLVEILDSTPTGPTPQLLVDAPVVSEAPVIKAEVKPPPKENILTEEMPVDMPEDESSDTSEDKPSKDKSFRRGRRSSR